MKIKPMKYRFSIVLIALKSKVPVMESIESVLNQDIGFDQNVQLIIVDDGLNEEASAACKAFESSHSPNIVYVKTDAAQAERGFARNLGLSFVEGRYVGFLDAGDAFSPSTLSAVWRYFREVDRFVNLVAIPAFEANGRRHPWYARFKAADRLISLIDEPYNYVKCVAASFYKVQVFESLSFTENAAYLEGFEFNRKAIGPGQEFGYLCSDEAGYIWRSNDLPSSFAIDGASFEDLMRPVDRVKGFTAKTKRLGGIERAFIAQEIPACLKSMHKDALSGAECKRLMKAYAWAVGLLSEGDIIQIVRDESVVTSALLLSALGKSMGPLLEQGCWNYSRFRVTVRDMYVDEAERTVQISCTFPKYGTDFYDVVLVSKSRKHELIQAKEAIDFEGPYDIYAGELRLDTTHVRSFELPLQDGAYELAYVDRRYGIYTPAKNVKGNTRLRFCSDLLQVGPVYGDYRVSMKRDSFRIKNVRMSGSGENARKRSDEEIAEEITALLEENRGMSLPLRKLAKAEKTYILVQDRPDKAGDNGQALFEYIMKHESAEVRANTYFVLSKESSDYEGMPYKEHIVDFGSEEHLQMFLNAKVLYSSHAAVKMFYPFEAEEFPLYADLLKFKFVWLQHGITHHDQSKQCNRLHSLCDAIVVSTTREHEEFTAQRYLYKPEQIVWSGFARFDKLVDEKERLVTLAPTWRRYLVGPLNDEGHNPPVPGFTNSEYYQVFRELLTSPKLLEALDAYGYRLQFVLHPGMSCYEQEFEKFASKNVSIRTMREFSYNEAFRKSALFVTDYSSTFFDFAYLKKPVICLQFDEEQFFGEHYKKGSFDFERDGFGPVTHKASDTVDAIIGYLSKDCEIEGMYLGRIDGAFGHISQGSCCERIMDATRQWL